MATYTVMLNEQWPEGTAEKEFGKWDNKDAARKALEGELTKLYPGLWMRANEDQYAQPNANVGDPVMGNIIEHLTERETIERWIATTEDGIKGLERALADKRDWLIELQKRLARLDNQQSAPTDN